MYRITHHQEEVKDNYCIDLPPELGNLQRYFNATGERRGEGGMQIQLL